MLVSADALNSDYIEKKELKTALDRKQAGAARWFLFSFEGFLGDHSDLSELQVAPKDENGKHPRGWQAGRHPRALPGRLPARTQKIGRRNAHCPPEKKCETAEAAKKAEELKKQQSVDAEKAERSRHRLDEAFWKKTSESLQTTSDVQEKIDLLEDYLHEPPTSYHRAEAENQIEELHS